MADTIATSTLTPRANTDGKIVPVRQFKITDIPDAMRKMDWPVAAQLMEHWFNGEPWPTEDGGMLDSVKGHSEFAPNKYIEESIIKMKWVMGFSKVDEYIDKLRKTWNSPKAIIQMRDAFSNAYGNAQLDVYRVDFQSRGALAERFGYFNTQTVNFDPVGGSVDELRAGLGDFNIRVVAEGDVSVSEGYYTFFPVRLGYYIDDAYDFNDTGWHRTIGQPLGFWGFNGMALSIPELIASEEDINNQLQGVAVQSMSKNDFSSDRKYAEIDSQRFYLVTNKDFRSYREKYQRGGDFKVSSDIFYENISSGPIVIAK
jgi:hypothetical protein